MLPISNTNPIPQLDPCWAEQLLHELDPAQFQAILEAVAGTYQRGTVYPSWDEIFRAFHLTPFQDTRVVVVGQDPYHGPGQAHGLCFSVRQDQAFPPSLRNIFKELKRDLGIEPPFFGDLTPWAAQGVLLLNTSLTVEAGRPGSHTHLGWEKFTDAVIRRLSHAGRAGIVFLLWGAHAQDKEHLIDTARHHVLKAPHPSPLSAHRGFIGCGHFSQVNTILRCQGEPAIDWALE